MEANETARAYKRDERGERYTYADYATWDDGNRYELIDGKACMMSAPSTDHQRVLVELGRQFANYLRGKPCEVFLAPFDVCLNAKGDDDDTVVQPDLVVICDPSILDKKRCNGAPDLVIEVASPSTSRLDRMIKLNKYLQAGVREFWIADPDDRGVTVHVLENGKYVVSAYEGSETVSVAALDGCKITLPDVFGD